MKLNIIHVIEAASSLKSSLTSAIGYYLQPNKSLLRQ